jgi:hypothetical protein
MEFRSAENVQRQIYASMGAVELDLSLEENAAVTLLSFMPKAESNIDCVAKAVGISTDRMRKVMQSKTGRQILESKLPAGDIRVEVVSAGWLKERNITRFEIRSKAMQGEKVIYNRQTILAASQPGKFVHVNFASPSEKLLTRDGLEFAIETSGTSGR